MFLKLTLIGELQMGLSTAIICSFQERGIACSSNISLNTGIFLLCLLGLWLVYSFFMHIGLCSVVKTWFFRRSNGNFKI